LGGGLDAWFGGRFQRMQLAKPIKCVGPIDISVTAANGREKKIVFNLRGGTD
jgi:hypothetical protein